MKDIIYGVFILSDMLIEQICTHCMLKFCFNILESVRFTGMSDYDM